MRQFLIFLVIFFFSANANANFIRDSEIEEVIGLIVEPLKKAASIQDLKIYLIDDETPNAFTVGGNVIFIHTGLIIKFPDPDVFRGVIAHEMGHILGKHIVRREEVIDNYTMAAMGTAAIGLITALSNINTNVNPGLFIMLGGNHVADRSIKAYSRNFESSADQAALKLLEKSKHSSVGMINFFKQTKMESASDLINPYEQTHPMSQARLIMLKNDSKKSQYKTSQNSAELIYKFNRIAAKLAAYTLPLNKIKETNFKENSEELKYYTRAIKFFRMGNFDEALNNVDNLLTRKKDDPFYHELKGQILFDASRRGALDEYNIAQNLRKNDLLILLGRAIVGINEYKNNKVKSEEFYKNLEFIIRKEPDNLLVLYYLSIYYESSGLKGKSYLNSAIIASKLGQKKNAKNLALAALRELQPGTPDWYKANDIISIE